MFACTFIGHKDFPENLYQNLYNEIENLIVFDCVNVFYVGTNGAFDRAVYRVLSELKKKYEIKINVALAHLNQKSTNFYKSEETFFPNVLERTPFKYAINKRNIFMIKQSQYMICYLNNTFSNSSTFVKSAKSRKLKIVNIGSFDISKL